MLPDTVTPENDVQTAVDDAMEYVTTIGAQTAMGSQKMKASDSKREGFGDALEHVKAGLRGQTTITTERGKEHTVGKERRFAGQSAGGIITTVLAIGITAVVAVVLTVVMDQTQSSVSVSDSNLSDANDQIIGGYGDAMSLLGVVFLVLLLGVVVAALFGLVPGQG